ncbi:flagellar hook capping FlgD N-terminal domain-containing protein [Clostridium sp.]|uniref:flagellar hook assembly protein FlgD n=1 Tax=Clostridium sp. TaxID=1506 RepID=UPI001B55F245|nr:flagellar hook capping FlgD N-terminal domain-containing protein [Clostridium sp.]MBP3917382.1 flagellar biosynthesis protein FlgD [Clostridium sp.]
MEISSYSSFSAKTTDRGTKIIKPGEDMNKDAFLKILAGELSNLDPTADVDSTQYVTQMAQFVTMEQMSNLNSTMTYQSYNSLVGKGVTVNCYDSEGNPYTGIVAGVTNNYNGDATITLEVAENGKNVYKDFSSSDIVSVIDVPDYSLSALSSLNGNISFLVASSFTGKNVELNVKNSDDTNVTGKVVSVTKDEGIIKVSVQVDGSDEIVQYSYDKIIKVEN